MASPTLLVNQALGRLGEERLTSLADTSVRAQNVRDVYDEVRQRVLRSTPLNFATRRAILGPTATTPAFRWQYQFALPAASSTDGGWLRTVAVWQDPDERRQAAYSEEGRFLLADVPALYLTYIADVSDLNQWESLARQYLMFALAAELAVTLTNSDALHQQMLSLAKAALAQCSAVDSIDDFPGCLPEGDWSLARFAPFGGGLCPDDVDAG